MTDQEYMLRAIQLAKKRRRMDESESHGRCSDRKKTAGSSGKVIIKNAENFMQSAMQSHRLQNRQRVRQSMLRWNHAVIMARHRRVRKQS